MKNYRGLDCKCVLLLKDRTREIKNGDLVSFPDGHTGIVASLVPPHKSSSIGRMYVMEKGKDFAHGYFPNVLNCQFIEC